MESQKGRDTETKHRRRQDTGQCWPKSQKFQGAREPEKETEAGRDMEKRGRDGRRLTIHHSSWHWQENFTAPRLLSLPQPPSSSAVPAAQPSPIQEQAAGAWMLLSQKASQTHGGSHMQPTETQLPELCAGSALCQGWLGAILPRHRDQPVVAGIPHCLHNALHFTPQPAPAGRHAQAVPPPTRAPQHSINILNLTDYTQGCPSLSPPVAF